jgi:hypothetical protein
MKISIFYSLGLNKWIILVYASSGAVIYRFPNLTLNLPPREVRMLGIRFELQKNGMFLVECFLECAVDALLEPASPGRASSSEGARTENMTHLQVEESGQNMVGGLQTSMRAMYTFNYAEVLVISYIVFSCPYQLFSLLLFL